MIPLYISDCFAWLHPARGRRGVVLCSAFGNEEQSAHRPFVILAEALAGAGLPTLRFDYHGTGDSAGTEANPDRLRTWTADIQAAADWLRTQAGVEEVALCGLRFGATLAALAAVEMGNVDRLALLAPVVSGKTYLRELTMLARASAAIWVVDTSKEDPDWFEAAGLRLDSTTRRTMEALDLRKLPRAPANQVLLMEPGQSSPSSESLRALGAEVVQRPFPGFGQMMLDSLENDVPYEAFAQLVHWLGEGAPPATEAAPPALPAPQLRLPDLTETPIRFGPDNEFFGIACDPTAPRRGPAVLILNTGANPHTGICRLSVTLARQLAELGIASFRIDISGLGDSSPQTGEKGQAYARACEDDVRHAIDWLTRNRPGEIILFGPCSGAFTAWHTAVRDARIGGLVLLNLQKFLWKEGIPLKVVQISTLRTTHYYMQNAANPDVWRRILRGQVNVRRIGTELAARLFRRARVLFDTHVAGLLGIETEFNLVRREARILRRRGVSTLMLLSFHDPGIDELEQYFGTYGKALRRSPNFQIKLLDNADHTLSFVSARQRFLDAFMEYIQAWPGLAPERARAQPGMVASESAVSKSRSTASLGISTSATMSM